MSEKGKFTNYVTDERVLFSYRFIVSAGTLYLAFIGTKILNTNDELKQSFNDFKYSSAIEIAGVKSQVSIIDKRVDAHAQRLDNGDRDRNALWNRVYEIISGMKR